MPMVRILPGPVFLTVSGNLSAHPKYIYLYKKKQRGALHHCDIEMYDYDYQQRKEQSKNKMKLSKNSKDEKLLKQHYKRPSKRFKNKPFCGT